MTFNSIIPVYIIVILLVACLCFTVFCISKKEFRHTKFFRRIGLIVLLLCTMARPATYDVTPTRVVYNNLDVYFIVDMSGSMSAKDCDGGSTMRYKMAIDDILEISRRFNGSSFSIIASDYSTYTALPLTSDYNMLVTAVNSLSPKNSSLSADSNINDALKQAADHIVRSQNQSTTKRGVVLFYLGDGEDNTNDSIVIPAELKSVALTGLVLGYGTESGAQLYKINSSGQITNDEIKDEYDRNIVSRLNKTNIAKIGDELGLKYSYRNNGMVDVKLLDGINQGLQEYVMEDRDNYKEYYWISALGFIALLLWEFSYILNKILLERKPMK